MAMPLVMDPAVRLHRQPVSESGFVAALTGVVRCVGDPATCVKSLGDLSLEENAVQAPCALFCVAGGFSPAAALSPPG